MKLLSVIFSFRNEANNFEKLVNRVVTSIKKLDHWDYELIFVNDCSSDNSLDILLQLQKKFKIIIINMSRKFGVSPCVLAGMKIAKGDAVIYMDSDLQDPPELIPELIKKFDEGNEIVHTKRIKRLGENRLKLLITKFAYKIINKFSEIPLPEEVGDFKLISKRAVQYINDLKEVDPYMRGITVWLGFKQEFINYERQKRGEGKTKFSIFTSSNPIKEFIRGITSYSPGPLYLGIFVGFISILASLILICYAFWSKFSGAAIPGSSGVIIAISFFSGIILTTIGIMGIYIARIYQQSQNRPRYIIKYIIKPKE